MFRKNKEVDITDYLEFIKSIIVDKDIRSEVVEYIDYIVKYGVFKLEFNNLYGRIGNKVSSDYLEIKRENNALIISFTKYESRERKYITIDKLEGNKTYINVLEQNVTETIPDSTKVDYDNKKTELIYTDATLIYKSVTEESNEFSGTNEKMIYDNDTFCNELNICREWFHNDASIRQVIKKNYFGDTIEEGYYICLGKRDSEYENVYIFSKLDREEFISFMTGEITFDELVNLNKDKNNEEVEKVSITHLF